MMILTGGKAEDAEIHVFHKVGQKMTGVVVADMYKETDVVRTENKPPCQYLKQVSAFLNEEEKKDIIKSSMMITRADGDIDPAEVLIVENFGKALVLKPAQVKEIIAAAK